MGKYFGTDGFRGEANADLKVGDAFKIGRFIGWYYGNEHPGVPSRIVIGKDTRRSSYMFEDALSSGITASGADAYLMHVTTTPSVSYIVRVDGFDCGVMISASHNPYYDNGIKVIGGNGKKLGDDVIEKIESYLDGEFEIPLALRDGIGRTVDYVAGRNRYIGYLISTARSSYKNKHVAIDCANGSASSIARPVFDALGAKVHIMGAEPNGININDGVGSTHLEALREFVLKEGCDVGFAFDGDADRCLAVDEKGREINGDQIMYACGLNMREAGQLNNDTIVVTVMSNFGLFKAFEKAGLKYEKVNVGDRYVWERMSEKGYSLGGEQSGHIIFSKYATTGDGLLTAIRLMDIYIDSKREISNLFESCPMYPQYLLNVKVADKDAAMNDPAVLAEVDRVEKELSGNGRVLYRRSGTEPVVRVMVEAGSMEECRRLCGRVAQKIREAGLEAE